MDRLGRSRQRRLGYDVSSVVDRSVRWQMDASIFSKMKLKPGGSARVFYPPPSYPMPEEFHWSDDGQAGFVHVFVESRQQFPDRFGRSVAACAADALLWVSYRKTVGDINRDSLWTLLLAANYHPVSQVSLGAEWSAVRAKPNEPGVQYEPPANVKR